MLLCDCPKFEKYGWIGADLSRVLVKLGDFGSSRFLTNQEANSTLSIKGTLQFMAPEIRAAILANRIEIQYGNTADVFSAALCFLVLFIRNISGRHV